jgi:hypothetical protein
MPGSIGAIIRPVGGVSNYQAEDRRGRVLGEGEDPAGERFRKLEARLKDAGRVSYEAAQSLCLDFYWFPDDNPAWLDRLINGRLVAAKVAATGQLGTAADEARLRAAVAGLLALAEGGKGRGSR